jgi:hypothetical protein
MYPTYRRKGEALEMEIKQTLAEEAVRIVNGARRSAYGRPEQNFERIARLWNAHMLNTQRDGNLTAVDVATFCRLIKEARLAETPDHRDSFVDILGYTLCQAEIALPWGLNIEPDAPPPTPDEVVHTVYEGWSMHSPEERRAFWKARQQSDSPPLAPNRWGDREPGEPAWKRANVGDVVQIDGCRTDATVIFINPDPNSMMRLQVEDDHGPWWARNEDVMSIVKS